MMKRLFTSLFAGALIFAGANAEAKVPVISNMPDITIGTNNYDDENGPTSPKMFIFTNAFNFDEKVNYKGSAASVSDLKWSFAEGNSPDGSAAQWYTINGINPIAVGATDIVAKETAGAPKAPAASLRAAGTGATFRDIVLSPASRVAPTVDQLAEHALGKVVRFYVSDGSGVAKKDVLVKSVNGVYNSAVVPAMSTTISKVDGLDTDPGVSSSSAASAGWWATTTTNLATSNLPAFPAYTASAKAIELKAGTNPGTGYVFAEVQDNPTNRMKFSALGATAAEAQTKIARAKFYVYASGQSSTGMPTKTMQIPNMRFKLQTGFLVANALEVFHANINQWSGVTSLQNLYWDAVNQIAPSTDSTAPSAYTVDYKPLNAAYVYTNNLQNNENLSFMRSIEMFQNMPYINGSLFVTESWIGVYPMFDMTGKTAMKTFSGSALYNYGTSGTYTNCQQNADSTANTTGATYYNATIYTGLGGSTSAPYGTQSFNASQATVTADANGVALDARNFTPVFPATGGATVALLEANIAAIAKPTNSIVAADYATVARVSRDKTYLVRFTADNAYVAAANMPGIQFRSTVSYFWTSRLEVNYASLYAGTAQNGYLRACMPGSTEKQYDVVMNSPMDSNIKAVQTAWDNAPGPGNTGSTNIRDFAVLGISMVDTLSGVATEKGYMRMKKVEIFEFDKVQD